MKALYTVLFLLMTLAKNAHSQSFEFAAGNWNYEILSNQKIWLSVNVFSRCYQASIPDTLLLHGFNHCNENINTYALKKVGSTGVILAMLCPKAQLTDCTNGELPGFKLTRYEVIID